MHKLHLFTQLEYETYKSEILSMPGNILIQTPYGPFKSSSLKYPGREQEFLNFMINYLNTEYQADNSYHLAFSLGLYQLLRQEKGYYFKELIPIKEIKDQIIFVAQFEELSFIYVIWLATKKAFILDLQLKPQSRFADHQLVLKQIFDKFDIRIQVDAILLKEVKSQMKPAQIIASICDFLYKYIDSSNDIYKIEHIKINTQDSKLIIDRIIWSVYKCFQQDILVEPAKYILPQNHMYYYDEWKKELNETSQSMQKIQNSISKSSFLSQIGNSTISHVSKEESKIRQPQYREIPVQQFLINNEQQPKYSLKDQARELPPDMISRQELQEILDAERKQIKADLLLELQAQQQDWQQDFTKKDRNSLNNQIADEYLSQVKFQKYKEYMEYLLSYYQQNEPEEYDKLLKEYHNRLRETAVNGMVEIQRKELLKLQELNRFRIRQENEAIQLAQMNQKTYKAKLNAPLEFPQPKQQYQFQFSKYQDVDPFDFKVKQNVEPVKGKLDMSDTEIQNVMGLWDFSKSSIPSASSKTITKKQSTFRSVPINTESFDRQIKQIQEQVYSDSQSILKDLEGEEVKSQFMSKKDYKSVINSRIADDKYSANNSINLQSQQLLKSQQVIDNDYKSVFQAQSNRTLSRRALE